MRTLTLLFLSFSLFCAVSADKGSFGDACLTANTKLQVGTWQLSGDCDPTTYCAPNGTCAHKGCRKDIFPFGYGGDELPPMCSRGQFCPDEGDACQDVLAVGSACQLNRDDECEGPPNWRDLADKKYGRNVNGSVCLDFTCYWANATLGSKCVVENTPYIVYGPNNQEFIDIVSRDNCMLGLYCDSGSTQCLTQKSIGESCAADKECLSMNCLSSLVCGNDIDAAVHVGTWVYVLVGVALVAGIMGTLVSLFFLHRKQRDRERGKRLQYWREQNAFRQNIMQLRDTARASFLSLPAGTNSARSTLYGIGSDDSHQPILQNAGSKGSGLKHQNYAEESDRYDYDNMNVVQEREKEGLRFRTGQAF